MKYTAKQLRWMKFWMGIAAFVIILFVLEAIKIPVYKEYTNSVHKFTIQYPSGWMLSEEPGAGGLVVFASPATSAMDMFSENVNISFQPLKKEGMTLEAFSKEAIRQVTGVFEGAIKVLEKGPARLAGQWAYKFVFVGNMKGVENPLQYMFIWTFHGNKAYIITYVAQKSEYDHFLPYVKRMLRSFHF